ncbi:MAG TPA: hypothetical protein DEG64_08660, partial [Marinobacter adhaerens]|nr:hypothetical protein [Marinobacter adhaerens]
ARQGVASLLYQAAMQRLTANGVDTLTTDASLEALPFFESRGLKVSKEQTVERNGVKFRRFAMTGPSKRSNHHRSA